MADPLSSRPHNMFSPLQCSSEKDIPKASPSQSPSPSPSPSPLPASSSSSSSSKKQKQRKFMPKVRYANEVAFRVVCDASTGGALIGSSGSVIAPLRRETGARIHCYPPAPDCDKRVILIIGDRAVNKTVELENDVTKESVAFEVSSAQEALMKVVTKVMEIEKYFGACYLLVVDSQVGALLGKGGRNVQRIRNNTGALIQILPPPSSAWSEEQMVVIAGDILAITKALHQVSEFLQDCLPLVLAMKVPPRLLSQPVATPNITLAGPPSEFFPHLGLTSIQNAGYPQHQSANDHSVYRDSNSVGAVDSVNRQQEVVFRLLCPARAGGGVIGVKGNVVRAMQDETGACIIVAEIVGDCEERVITITAMEDIGSLDSPAQRATIRVFTRLIEVDNNSNMSSFDLHQRRIFRARLLVEGPYISCLTGNQGNKISKVKETVGADILVLGEEKVPQCAAENDYVVQISGDYRAVLDALYLVTAELRNCLLPSEILAKKTSMSAVPDVSSNRIVSGSGIVSSEPQETLGPFSDLHQKTPITQGLEQLTISPKSSDTLPKFNLSQTVGETNTEVTTRAGFNNCGEGVELDSANKGITLTKTTKEMAVPGSLFASIFYEDGNNLAQMKQISGAQIEVQEPEFSDSAGKVVISGSPIQTRSAISCLKAFILGKQK